MAHHCHATACTTPVPPELLMCPTHWRMVPRAVQRLIWQHYRPGQCDDWDVSVSYCTAARMAVVAVAAKEGKVPDTELYDVFARRAAQK